MLASAAPKTQRTQIERAHRARLLSYARRRGLDAEEALDAVQDSFLSFLELPEARSVARSEGAVSETRAGRP